MTDFLIHSSTAPYIRLAALIIAITMSWYLSRQGAPLRTPDAPRGVVSLELAWTQACATKVVNAWSAMKDTAVHQVLADFIFIAGYSVLLLCVGLAAERAAMAAGLFKLASVAHLAAWGGLLAGAFDCLENVGLLAMLNGHISGAVAFATSLCASVKFILGGITIAVVLVAFVVI